MYCIDNSHDLCFDRQTVDLWGGIYRKRVEYNRAFPAVGWTLGVLFFHPPQLQKHRQPLSEPSRWCHTSYSTAALPS